MTDFLDFPGVARDMAVRSKTTYRYSRELVVARVIGTLLVSLASTVYRTGSQTTQQSSAESLLVPEAEFWAGVA
jgi:hypothetical protein